ncbi:probable 2-oxoglutarate-dependent dioxygenase AOP1 [Argentina anserina]|uniref:probable 2-oxoglutarate-dependent dioxygenase AOP1 n=1 Tax=Argentina anserina TaxID=57926 RepID=UPI0021763349|nr:probable 2-oxoglutarate-dependent dioxygenase AOP1 [Potentilla anserina]
MGSECQYQIPTIDFSNHSSEVDRGTEEWYSLCKRVREACENNGFFEIVYDKIPLQLRAETFSMIRQVFGLPLETKKKYCNPRPYGGYLGQNSKLPLFESFGLEDSSNYESLRSFTQLMWPNGHDQFCNTVISMVKKLDELKHMIEVMILDSYGLGDNSKSILTSATLLRIMKYSSPPLGEYMQGLHAHTDKALSTILCDDQVSGLEIETKDGKWVKLSFSPTSLVFIVGDLLMAWSNGRMHAAKHRVMMSGEKERYSLGQFVDPVEGTIIKAPKELVDEEHPRILKDIDYTNFSKFFYSDEGRFIDTQMQIFAFAGIS